MAAEREPLFLARETYRRRRLIDAARFLPYAAAFLFAIPLLWSATAGTAGGLVYLFAVWSGLIGAAFLLSRRLPRGGGEAEADHPPEGG